MLVRETKKQRNNGTGAIFFVWFTSIFKQLTLHLQNSLFRTDSFFSDNNRK